MVPNEGERQPDAKIVPIRTPGPRESGELSAVNLLSDDIVKAMRPTANVSSVIDMIGIGLNNELFGQSPPSVQQEQVVETSDYREHTRRELVSFLARALKPLEMGLLKIQEADLDKLVYGPVSVRRGVLKPGDVFVERFIFDVQLFRTPKPGASTGIKFYDVYPADTANRHWKETRPAIDIGRNPSEAAAGEVNLDDVEVDDATTGGAGDAFSLITEQAQGLFSIVKIIDLPTPDPNKLVRTSDHEVKIMENAHMGPKRKALRLVVNMRVPEA